MSNADQPNPPAEPPMPTFSPEAVRVFREIAARFRTDPQPDPTDQDDDDD